MSRLIDFYRGRSPDTEGRSISDLWAYSDEELESVHDFIQWLFPLRETSRFNPNAPLLSDSDIAAFRSDPELRSNLLRSIDVYLAFLGLQRSSGRVVEAADFASKKRVFDLPDHNWLRITRVLTSLRLLGLEEESRAFFAFLREYREVGRSGITEDTFRYWEQATATPRIDAGGGR